MTYRNFYHFQRQFNYVLLSFHRSTCACFFTFWAVCVLVDSYRRGRLFWSKVRPSSVLKKVVIAAVLIYLFHGLAIDATNRSTKLIHEVRWRSNFMRSIVPGKRAMDANFFRSWHIWAIGTFDFTATYLICAELYRGLYRITFKRECTPRARLLFTLTFSALACFGLHRLDVAFHFIQCMINYLLVIFCQQLLPKRAGKVILWSYNIYSLWFIHTYGPRLVMPQWTSTGRRLYGWNGCGRFCVLKNISFAMDTLNATFKTMEREAAMGADTKGADADGGGGGGRAAYRRRRRQRRRRQQQHRRLQQEQQQPIANSSSTGSRMRKGAGAGAGAAGAAAAPRLTGAACPACPAMALGLCGLVNSCIGLYEATRARENAC
jgi:hypothetical protein